MDGVLVDTEPLKERAHRRTLRALGGSLSHGTYRRHMGEPHRRVAAAFLRAAGLEPEDDVPLEAYERRFEAHYRSLLESGAEPAPGAVPLVAALAARGHPLALVTSSHRWMAELVLGDTGLEGAFRAVVTAEDVTRQKPDPEPYRRAVEALEFAGAGVALEDTRAGIASAAGAGLRVTAVRHAHNRDHDFGAAAAVVESLADTGALLDLIRRVARAGA